MAIVKIPEKIYFKIGEVSKLLDLEPYVLRYWETEFSSLKPEKTRTGQRSYRRQDIKLLMSIQYLLYDEMYTIAGARKRLKEMKKEGQEPLEHTIERLKLENEKLVLELEPLKIALSPLQKRNTSLEKENRAVKAAYAELEKKNDQILSLQKEDNEGKVDLVAIESKLIESRRVIGRQAGENVRLQKSKDELQLTVDQQILELKVLHEKVVKLEANQKDAQALQVLEKRLEDSLRTVSELQSDKSEIVRKSSITRQQNMRGFLNLRRELETLLEAVN